jgi:hypothetical protein
VPLLARCDIVVFVVVSSPWQECPDFAPPIAVTGFFSLTVVVVVEVQLVRVHWFVFVVGVSYDVCCVVVVGCRLGPVVVVGWALALVVLIFARFSIINWIFFLN